MKLRSLFLAGLLGWLPIVAYAQPQGKQAKSKGAVMKMPDDATAGAIADKLTRLNAAVDALRGTAKDDLLAEVEVYAKAVEWVTRHREYFGDTVRWTVEVLDHGLRRAGQLALTDAPWRNANGMSVLRAYRSRVDGSVQPYAVTLPADYGKDPGKTMRLDVVLH